MINKDDQQFCELVIQNKFASENQARECMAALRNYNEAGITKTLSSIFLEKGVLTTKQISAVHHLQGKDNQFILRGYTLIKKLGQGGIGSVYLGRQDSLGRQVAIKIMSPHLASDSAFVKRFMREARISAQLDHPNIVRAIDFGESESIYFFVMEYIEGNSLQRILQNQGIIPEKRACEIILQVTYALEYAQKYNLVHRDIKPDNIMITNDGVVKLCDMGLAKICSTDLSMTNTGAIMGTPNYIAPEQAMDIKDVDSRADIYSLGVSFYHLLSGKLPFQGDTLLNILHKHISGEIPNVHEQNPHISQDVAAIIMKMMAKNKEDRYQSAAGLATDLQLVLNGGKPCFEKDLDKKHPAYSPTRVAPTPALVKAATNVEPLAFDDNTVIDQQDTSSGPTVAISSTTVANRTAAMESVACKKQKKAELAAPGKFYPRLLFIIILATIGGTAYYFRMPLQQLWQQKLLPLIAKKIVQTIREAKAANDSKTNTDVKPKADTNSQNTGKSAPQPKATQPKTATQPKIDTKPKVATQPKIDSEPKTATQPKIDTKPKVATQPKIDSEPKTATQPKIDTEPKTATQPKIDSEPKVATQPKIDTEPKVATQPKIDSEPKVATQPKIDTEPKVATQPKIDTEPKVATQPKIDTEPKVATQPKIDTESKTAAQAKIDSEPKNATQPKIDTEPKTAAQAKIDTESKSSAQAQIGTEPNTAAQPKIGTEPKNATQPKTTTRSETSTPATTNKQAATLVAKQQSKKLAQRGWKYYAAQQYVKAEKDFREAIRLDAKNADAYARRASFYYFLGKYDQALKDAARCLELGKPQALDNANLDINNVLREAKKWGPADPGQKIDHQKLVEQVQRYLKSGQ